MSKPFPKCRVIFAAIFFLGGLVFFLSIYLIEGWIGSPSSTSALILVVALPYSVIAGLLGGVMGAVFEKALWVLRGGKDLGKKGMFILASAIFIPVIILAIVTPLAQQLKWNNHNEPGVIINTGIVHEGSFDIQTDSPGLAHPCLVKFARREEGKQIVKGSNNDN